MSYPWQGHMVKKTPFFSKIGDFETLSTGFLSFFYNNNGIISVGLKIQSVMLRDP